MEINKIFIGHTPIPPNQLAIGWCPAISGNVTRSSDWASDRDFRYFVELPGAPPARCGHFSQIASRVPSIVDNIHQKSTKYRSVTTATLRSYLRWVVIFGKFQVSGLLKH